jgi:hypothetical protein
MPWRDRSGYSQVFFDGGWHTVDIAILVRPETWTASRIKIGADTDGSDGWSIDIPSNAELVEDSLYFLHAVGRDQADHRDGGSHLVRHGCSGTYLTGDYNNDGAADLSDLYLLTDFITRGGPPPVGGGARADANCDNYVNVTDIVYFMNYLFGTVDSPCY